LDFDPPGPESASISSCRAFLLKLATLPLKMKILLFLLSIVVGILTLLSVVGAAVVYLLAAGDFPGFIADEAAKLGATVKNYTVIASAAGAVLGIGGGVIGFISKNYIRAVILLIKGAVACAAMIYVLTTNF